MNPQHGNVNELVPKTALLVILAVESICNVAAFSEAFAGFGSSGKQFRGTQMGTEIAR